MKTILTTILLLAAIWARAQDPDYPPAPATASNIIAAEYWIDTDPGLGNGTAITVTPGVSLSGVIATLNTTGLSNGIHRFALRSKNADGQWSLSSIQDFLVDYDVAYPATPAAPSNLIAAEYWIDTDPGLGNGTAITVTPGVSLSGVIATLNTTGLSNGIHRFALRSKNADGQWNLSSIQEFLVDTNPAYSPAPAAATNIVAAEYFIDTDPGMGNGIAIPIAAGLDLPNINVAVNSMGLSASLHYLVLRSKSSDGTWSISNIHTFLVNTDFSYPPAPVAPGNIVYAEYFFDNDPGFGNGTTIAITPGVDLSNVSFAANTSSLVDGNHTLFIRSLDDWSITNFTSFLKGAVLPLDFISFTAAASANNVLLNWVTANETNTSHFDIEFSRDGIVFNKISEKSSANTAGNHQYNYLHIAPGEGNLYYRIRQVDIDGAFTYSRVAVVNMNKKQMNAVLLYPNPTTSSILLKNINAADVDAIQVIAVDGKVVMQPVVTTAMQYNVQNLVNGFYTLRVVKKDGSVNTLSFLKQ